MTHKSLAGIGIASWLFCATSSHAELDDFFAATRQYAASLASIDACIFRLSGVQVTSNLTGLDYLALKPVGLNDQDFLTLKTVFFVAYYKERSTSESAIGPDTHGLCIQILKQAQAARGTFRQIFFEKVRKATIKEPRHEAEVKD